MSAVPILVLYACSNKADENAAVINADFTYSASNKVYLHKLLPDSWPVVDSAITNDEGRVRFELNDPKAGLVTVGTDRDNLVILQTTPGESQSLSADIRQIPHTYTTKGSEGSKLLERFKKKTLEHLDIIDSLYTGLDIRRDSSNYQNNHNTVDSLTAIVKDRQKEYQLDLVRNNKDVLAVLVPLYQPFGRLPLITISEYPDLFMEIDKQLMEKHPDNTHVLDLHQRVERYRDDLKQLQEAEKKLMPGMPAPGFSAPDATGKSVSVSDFQGNFMILYFWSEKIEDYNRKMDSVYKAVNNNTGLILVTVYHGNDKLVWQKTAGRYDRQSVHLLASPVALGLYNSKDKSRMVLVDPEGKIVSADITVENLEEHLNQNASS